MRHTPGPWQVTPDKCRVQTSDESADYEIADCSGGGHPDTKHIEANARLIAMAPELLEALELAQHALESFISEESRAHALAHIYRLRAKAQGDVE